MAQIKDGKVKIHKVEINVNDVLSWIKKQGRYVTSVELRDQFNWPLRETARQLMKLLAKKGRIIIAPNPVRKRSYVYGLPGMKKPSRTLPQKSQQKPESSSNPIPLNIQTR